MPVICTTCGYGHPMCPACNDDDFTAYETCRYCNGSGRIYVDDDYLEYIIPDDWATEEICYECNGEGRVELF